MHGKWRGRKNLEVCVALRPGGGDCVLFRVDIHACLAKRRDAPGHGASRLWRSAHTPANVIGQATQILDERRFAQRILNNFWRNLLAKGFSSRRTSWGIRFRRITDTRK